MGKKRERLEFRGEGKTHPQKNEGGAPAKRKKRWHKSQRYI
jgi:hypothetical protein